MTFYVECDVPWHADFDPEETGRQVLAEALSQEGCPFACGVSLLLTGDEEIRALNREHRDRDSVTDVLSFPAIDFEAPAAFQAAWETDARMKDPDTGDVWLGDIVISVPRMEAQAVAYGHSVRREFAFLVTHSLLHLIGYDHTEEAGEAEMETRQTRILDTLGITRD